MDSSLKAVGAVVAPHLTMKSRLTGFKESGCLLSQQKAGISFRKSLRSKKIIVMLVQSSGCVMSKEKAALALCLAFIVYMVIAFTVYRFKHPELTETELLLHTVEALRFR